MPTTQERIAADLKAAMKARDGERLAALRLLLTAVKNRSIELGREVEEEELIALVRREIKQHRESAEGFAKGDRPEAAAKEEAEIGFLEAYLPPAVDEAEIRRAVEAFIAEQGLEGPKGMGPVMKAMIARFGGAADAAQISRIARELLGQ